MPRRRRRARESNDDDDSDIDADSIDDDQGPVDGLGPPPMDDEDSDDAEEAAEQLIAFLHQASVGTHIELSILLCHYVLCGTVGW